MNARERVRRRFDQWVRAQRAHGESQERLAKRIGRSQSWINKATARGPRLDDLDAVAALMATTPEALIQADDAEDDSLGAPEDSPMHDALITIRFYLRQIPPERLFEATNAALAVLQAFVSGGKKDATDGDNADAAVE